MIASDKVEARSDSNATFCLWHSDCKHYDVISKGRTSRGLRGRRPAKAMSKRKLPAQEEEGATDRNDGASSLKKSKVLGDKFGGLSEEEVCKLKLPDHLRPGLDIVFVRGCLVQVGGAIVRFAHFSMLCRLASTQACTPPTRDTTTAIQTTTFVSTCSYMYCLIGCCPLTPLALLCLYRALSI